VTGAGDLFSTFYFTENEPGPALAIEPPRLAARAWASILVG
jgi:hypothetical protein